MLLDEASELVVLASFGFMDAFLVRNHNFELQSGRRSLEVKFLFVDVFAGQMNVRIRIRISIVFWFKYILKVGSCSSR